MQKRSQEDIPNMVSEPGQEAGQLDMVQEPGRYDMRA